MSRRKFQSSVQIYELKHWNSNVTTCSSNKEYDQEKTSRKIQPNKTKSMFGRRDRADHRWKILEFNISQLSVCYVQNYHPLGSVRFEDH